MNKSTKIFLSFLPLRNNWNTVPTTGIRKQQIIHTMREYTSGHVSHRKIKQLRKFSKKLSIAGRPFSINKKNVMRSLVNSLDTLRSTQYNLQFMKKWVTVGCVGCNRCFLFLVFVFLYQTILKFNLYFVTPQSVCAS